MCITEYNEEEIMQMFREEGRKEGIEEGRKEGKILGAVEILRTFNCNDEIKKIIMEKYNLTESDAEKYLCYS